jgi:hypothetical protein
MYVYAEWPEFNNFGGRFGICRDWHIDWYNIPSTSADFMSGLPYFGEPNEYIMAAVNEVNDSEFNGGDLGLWAVPGTACIYYERQELCNLCDPCDYLYFNPGMVFVSCLEYHPNEPELSLPTPKIYSFDSFLNLIEVKEEKALRVSDKKITDITFLMGDFGLHPKIMQNKTDAVVTCRGNTLFFTGYGFYIFDEKETYGYLAFKKKQDFILSVIYLPENTIPLSVIHKPTWFNNRWCRWDFNHQIEPTLEEFFATWLNDPIKEHNFIRYSELAKNNQF